MFRQATHIGCGMPRWKREKPWRITETWDIKREDLAGLIEQGAADRHR
jgi:hypothetical protein